MVGHMTPIYAFIEQGWEGGTGILKSLILLSSDDSFFISSIFPLKQNYFPLWLIFLGENIHI